MNELIPVRFKLLDPSLDRVALLTRQVSNMLTQNMLTQNMLTQNMLTQNMLTLSVTTLKS